MKEVEIDENIKSIDEISAKKAQWKPIIQSVIQTMSTTFGNASTPNAVEGMNFGLKVMFQENVQTVKDELIKYNDYLLKEVNGKTNFQLFAEKKNPHEFYRMINRLNDHFGGVFNMEAIGKLAPESKKVIDAEVSKRVKHDKYYDTYYKKSFAENKSLYRSFIPTKYRSENLERQKLGAISFGRTGGHTITTLMLLAKKDSKGNHLYTIDEVFDEKKLVAEKHQIFEEVINHSIKAGTSIEAAESNSPDANWLVDTMFDIIMDANKRINELAEKIDTTKDDFIYSEEFIKVCELSSTVFDVWQEIWRYKKACEAKLKKEFPNIKDKGDRYEHFSTINGPFSLMSSDIYMVLTNVRKYHDQNGVVNYGGMFTSGIRLAVAKQMILDWKKNGKGMPATVYMNSVKADKLYTQVNNDSGEYGGALYEKVNSKNEEITINRLMDGSLFKNVRYIPTKGNKKGHFENLPTYNSKKGDYDIPGVNTGNIIKDAPVGKAERKEPKPEEIKIEVPIEKEEAPKKEEIKKEAPKNVELAEKLSLLRTGIFALARWRTKVNDDLKGLNDKLGFMLPDSPEKQGVLDAIKEVNGNVNKPETNSVEIVHLFTNLYKAAENCHNKLDGELKQEFHNLMKYSQESVMTLTSIKEFMNSTGLKTLKGESIKSSSVKDIIDAVGEYRKKDKLVVKGDKNDAVNIFTNLNNVAKDQIELINFMQKKYGFTFSVDLSKNRVDDYIKIKSNPSVLDMAKYCLAADCLEQIIGLETAKDAATIQKVGALLHNENAFLAKAKELSKNSIFKNFIKKHKKDYHTAWKTVNNKAKSMREEYGEMLKEFKPSPGAYVVAAKDPEAMYQRMTSVTMAKIFSNPKNEFLLLGVAGGMYDITDINTQVYEKLKADKALSPRDDKFESSEINMDINTGGVEKRIMDHLVKHPKTYEVKTAPNMTM